MANEITARRLIGSDVWRIVRIDRLIDGVTAELERREGLCFSLDIHRRSRAWSRHPELRSRLDALYGLRGQEQAYRDRMANLEWERAERVRKAAERREAKRSFQASKCPTCGQHTLRAA